MQIFNLSSSSLCIQKTKEILYKEVDSKTVLFLCGGKTPKPLYEVLANEEIIKPAAAGMVDERFGEKWHEKSNEKMIRETGLLRYFEYKNIPWYSIIKDQNSNFTRHSGKVDASTASRISLPQQKTRDSGIDITACTQAYDVTLRELLFHFPKSVALLGIGADGHTAGIPVLKLKVKSQKSKLSKRLLPGGRMDSWEVARGESQDSSQVAAESELVTSYNDTSGIYGRRITMTFTALSMIDSLIIFVLGKDKKQALGKMFKAGPLEEIPARFYNSKEIAGKTILITDQGYI